MIGAFASRFLMTAAAMACLLAALAWATAATLFQTPPARLFAHGFSFEIPAGWECTRETLMAVCMPVENGGETMRFAVHANLNRTAGTSLDTFRAQLVKPFARTRDDGSQEWSTVLEVKSVTLDGREWLDAHHAYAEPRGDSRMMVTRNGPYVLYVFLASSVASRERAWPILDRLVASMQLDAGGMTASQ